jgi:hypothetical protein
MAPKIGPSDRAFRVGYLLSTLHMDRRASSMGTEDTSDRVIRLDLGYVPEAAVSGPLLIQDDGLALLTFNAMRLRPDGRYEPAGTALVEFQRCSCTRFGYPNDEALPGHPLYRRGLQAYGIFEVLDSSWIAQLEEQNRVAFPNSRSWGSRHFAFVFHDSMLECIARDLILTVSREPFPQVLRAVSQRFVRDGEHERG